MNPPDTQTRFKLIDGAFTPAQAGPILSSLVQSKIDFHTREKFSDEFRFGRDLSQSQKRLEELRQLNADLAQLVSSADSDHRILKIISWIEITVAPAPQPSSQTASTAAS